MRLIPLFLTVAAALLAQQANPLTDQVMARYKPIKTDWLAAAEVMPEEHYSFRLTPKQRMYSEWVAHAVTGNYGYCSVIKGVKTPDTHHLHSLKGKAELSKALLESFQYCDAALEGMTDAKALTGVKVGEKAVYPVTGMINLVASQNEHYGNVVGYLRTKGIVPPSTVRVGAKK